MVKNSGFRAWFYFRNGWTLYFAFIFASVNTLTVTYYLAIENIPELKNLFPSFGYYVIFVVAVGIPLLILIGYVHFKRSIAYKAETEVLYESNPFARRTLVNTELIVQLNLQLTQLLIKQNQEGKLAKEEIEKLNSIQNELREFLADRKFYDKKDLDYIKKMRNS